MLRMKEQHTPSAMMEKYRTEYKNEWRDRCKSNTNDIKARQYRNRNLLYVTKNTDYEILENKSGTVFIKFIYPKSEAYCHNGKRIKSIINKVDVYSRGGQYLIDTSMFQDVEGSEEYYDSTCEEKTD
jgi:hypothetical protein